MTKYLVAKAYKLERRAACRAKESARSAWTKPDTSANTRNKPESKPLRRFAALAGVLLLLLSAHASYARNAPSPYASSHARTGGNHGHKSKRSASALPSHSDLFGK